MSANRNLFFGEGTRPPLPAGRAGEAPRRGKGRSADQVAQFGPPSAGQTSQQTHAPSLIVGPDGLILSANEAAHRLLGYPKRGLIGLSLVWISPRSRRCLLSHVDTALARHQLQWGSAALLHADGRSVAVKLTFQPGLTRAGAAVAITVERAASKGNSGRVPGPTTWRNCPTSPVPNAAQPQPKLSPRASATRSQTLLPRACDDGAERARNAPRAAVGLQKTRERLGIGLELLKWLKAPVENARGEERTRALLVLEELETVLEECRRELGGHDPRPRGTFSNTERGAPRDTVPAAESACDDASIERSVQVTPDAGDTCSQS